MNKVWWSLIFSCVLSPLGATVLAPGGCTGLGIAGCPGAVASFNGDPLGTFVIGSTSVVSTAAINGTLRAAVYKKDDDTLDFYYQFTSAGPNAIRSITHFDFTGWTTDVGVRSDDIDGAGGSVGVNFVAGVQGPTFIDRQSASTVGFNYQDPLPTLGTGEVSYTMVVKTNSKIWAVGNTAIIDGISVNVATFAPVPEPTFYGLLALGVAGLFGASRYARRQV